MSNNIFLRALRNKSVGLLMCLFLPICPEHLKH